MFECQIWISLFYSLLTDNFNQQMSQEELSEALALLCGFVNIDIENQDIDLLDPNILIAVLVRLFPAKAQGFINQIQKDEDEGYRWEKIVNFIQSQINSDQKFDFEQFSEREIIQLYFLMADYLSQILEQQQKAYLKQQQQAAIADKNKKQQKKPSHDNSKQNKDKQNVKRQSKKKINAVNTKQKQPKDKPEQQPLQNQKIKDKQKENKSKSHSKSREKKSQPKAGKKTAQQIIGNQQLQKELIDEVKKVIEQKKPKSKSIKTNVLFRDQKNLEAVKAAKRKFDYYLQQFKNSKNKRSGKSTNQLKKEKDKKDELFLKVLEKKHKSIEEDMINQQIKYFMTLRDRKVAFVNKIHRLTQKLQRERLIDWTHQQRQVMLQQREKVKQRIEKADALFDKNMQVLREQYKEMKENKAKMQVDEFIVCNQLQKAVAKRKCDQIQLLKTLWQQQNSKLNNIMGDEQKVKNKLIDIYRKNRP